MITHVLNESKSPVEALIWTMWCGEQFLVQDDGEVVPGADFYFEAQAAKSDCCECQKRFLARVRDVDVEVEA